METVTALRVADVEMEDTALPPRKRFKASELPLSQAQRSSVEGLLHTFKKKGEFDVLRKKLYSQFTESDAKSSLITSITQLAESELDKNPVLLSKDRRQAVPLIEGAAERSEIYKAAEDGIDRIFDSFLREAELKLREIRTNDVGEDTATEERKRGSKSEEDYARESTIRRQAWAKMREQELQRQRQREEEEERQREEERRKKQAEEEAREKERAAEREKEKKRQQDWARELEERRERKRRQDAQWERERLEKEDKERKRREAEREKEFEAAALEELLAEGKRLATKSARPDDLPVKEPGSKESALAAIMKAEKLEREKAELEKASAAAATAESTGGQPDVNTSAFSAPVEETSKSGESLALLSVAAREEQKPKLNASPLESLRPDSKKNTPSEVTPRDRPAIPSEHSRRQPDTRSSRGEPTPSRKPARDQSEEDPKRKEITRASGARGGRSRSRSLDKPARRDRDRSKERNRDDRYRAERRRSRSSSLPRQTGYRDRSRGHDSRALSPPRSPARRRSRSRDPKDIDRYVPASSRRKDSEREHERDRRPSERGRDKPRNPRNRDLDGANDRDEEDRAKIGDDLKDKDQDERKRSPARGRQRNYSRSRSRTRQRSPPPRNRDRPRDSEQRRGRSRSHSRSKRSQERDSQDVDRDRRKDDEKGVVTVQIDRYMPSTSYRARRGELEAPARARTHALAGSHDYEERKRSRESGQNKDSNTRSDRDEGKDRGREKA